MQSRQTPEKTKRPLPRLWLMTDERIGGEDALLRAVERLPRGSGIVFRHYSLARAQRRDLFDKVRRAARRKNLRLLLSGPESLARAWKADGFHKGNARSSRLLCSAPVHDLREIRKAERSGADVLFLSPIFPTRSHPGAKALGRAGFASLARQARRPVIALGGMTPKHIGFLPQLGAYGWAAIDGLVA
jgi:thiamine-phosphate pyrophosphorylase